MGGDFYDFFLIGDDCTPDAGKLGFVIADPPGVTVTIVDSGIVYDPLAKPDAVTLDDIMDVPIGGLGIIMAKRSVDQMQYAREGDLNVTSITKRW